MKRVIKCAATPDEFDKLLRDMFTETKDNYYDDDLTWQDAATIVIEHLEMLRDDYDETLPNNYKKLTREYVKKNW